MPRPGRPGPFLGRPIDLFSVAGIAIAIHPSWLLVAAGISVLMRTMVVDHIPGAAGIAAAIGVMLIFYSCVLLHELAHSLVARRHGLEPKRIVLFLLGGVSQISKEASRPSHEYQVALSGPLISLVLSGVLFAIARTTSDADPADGVWGWLGWLNLLLAGFNLVPGFPLDGGRVLRSALWAATGDRVRATRIAAAGGKLVAVALIAGGFVGMFTMSRADGGAWPPVSFVVVGWFLYSMAGAAAEREGAATPKPVATEPVTAPEPVQAGIAAKPVLPAKDIIPEARRKQAARKRSVPAAKPPAAARRAVPPATAKPPGAGPPPATPVRRPARKSDRPAAAKTARLSAGRGGSPAAGRGDESPSAKPDARGRGAGSANRAGSARASRNQSRDRSGHPRTGPADARGNPRRG